MAALRVFTCDDHAGHYPVGTASVIVAEDERQARELMTRALADSGFRDFDFTLTELPLDEPKAVVLRDGDY